MVLMSECFVCYQLGGKCPAVTWQPLSGGPAMDKIDVVCSQPVSTVIVGITFQSWVKTATEQVTLS